MADNRAFISYRRVPGYPWARLIWDQLVDRELDVFLDLESLRAAGRFDDRLLTQIASRPYFLVVLTEGTLDRCSEPGDWMTREIEHAIEHGRVIVPVFIAPFETSAFPRDLPRHVREALLRSQGLTVYTQYLDAAIDKLVGELLTPIEVGSVRLTEEDTQFHTRTMYQIRAMPPPAIPSTPVPPVGGDTAPVTTPIRDTSTHDDAETRIMPARGAPEVPAAGWGATDQRTQGPGTPGSTAQSGTGWPPTAPPGPVGPGTPTAGAGATAFGATGPGAPGHEPTTPMPAHRTGPAPGGTGPAGPNRSPWVIVTAVCAAIAVIGAVTAVVLSRDDDPPPTTTIAATTTDAVIVEPVTSPPPATTEPGGDGARVYVGELGRDEWLFAGDRVRSTAGDHELVMTEAGALQLLTDGALVWAAPYDAVPTASALFQGDGNFVVYTTSSTESEPLWSSVTNDIARDGTLRVEDHDGFGRVVVLDAGGTERWRAPDAVDELAAQIEADRPTVRPNLEGWVVQLSAKWIGLREAGVEWDHADILDEHRALRAEFGAVLVGGWEYNLGLADERDDLDDDRDLYFTLVVQEFADKAAALEWCRAHRPGNCGVKFVSEDPLAQTLAEFT